VCKSELDIFSIPPTQTSVERGGWVEYNPISSLSDGTPIEFVVGGSGQDYVDLANTQLYVRAQILRADNTPIDNTNHEGPVNLWLHLLFSEIDIKLNDVLVTSTNNTYVYRADIETLQTYGPAAKESQLTASLFYKDVAVHLENGNPSDNAALNTGLKKRHSFLEDSAVVDMIGCIHSDLFFQDKYLPNDVTLRVRLVRQKDTFSLLSSENGATYKVKILDCKLFVRKAKLSASVFVVHAKALEHGNAKYPVRRFICKTFTVLRSNLDFSRENLFSGQLPTRFVIGCIDNDTFNGTYANLISFNFIQLKTLRFDSVETISKRSTAAHQAIGAKRGANQYITAYMSLFSVRENNKRTRKTVSRGQTIRAAMLSTHTI